MQEALDRLVGRADPRAPRSSLTIGLRRRQALDHQRQPPRRRRRRAPSANSEARGLQPLARQRFRSSRRPRLHARGDLFGEQFEKELGHLTPPLAFCWVASQASQHALAEVADADDVALPLGDADHAARVQQVEAVWLALMHWS